MCNLHRCYMFCTGVTLFALVLHLNCTALSQSESSNFFMYIIIQEKGSWFSLRPASNVICWVNALITVDKVRVPTSHPTLTSGAACVFILSWWIYASCYFVIVFIFQEVSRNIGNFLPKGGETGWPLVCCFPVWQHLVTLLTAFWS